LIVGLLMMTIIGRIDPPSFKMVSFHAIRLACCYFFAALLINLGFKSLIKFGPRWALISIVGSFITVLLMFGDAVYRHSMRPDTIESVLFYTGKQFTSNYLIILSGYIFLVVLSLPASASIYKILEFIQKVQRSNYSED
jgi:hypothetical protein